MRVFLAETTSGVHLLLLDLMPRFNNTHRGITLPKAPLTNHSAELILSLHEGKQGKIHSHPATQSNCMTDAPLPPVVGSKDEEHLKLLVIFHYVVAALCALFGSIPLIHVGLGLMMVLRPAFFMQGHQGSPPPEWLGFLFIGLGGFIVLSGWGVAVCTLISGRYLAKRKKRMFSFVMAAVLSMFMPFGTALGIFTIIVLNRDSVQRLYKSA